MLFMKLLHQGEKNVLQGLQHPIFQHLPIERGTPDA